MIANADDVLVWLEDLGDALPRRPLRERKLICDALARLLLEVSLEESGDVPAVMP